jgi:RNA polymerase sigma-70 factor (ECF subfamily)
MQWEDELNHLDIAMIEHLDHLYGYAMVLTCNKADAEELVLGTYRRAVKDIRGQQTVTMKSWLFTILRDTWFKQVHRPPISGEITQVDAEECGANFIREQSNDPLALDASKLDVTLVQRAIILLPVLLREIILLREYVEFSCGETASIIGCPVDTVKARRVRARAKLRILLAAQIRTHSVLVKQPRPVEWIESVLPMDDDSRRLMPKKGCPRAATSSGSARSDGNSRDLA